MEIVNFKFDIKKTLEIPVVDAVFKGLLSDAIAAKTCMLAFDLDFQYTGLEGPAQGLQITPDIIIEGGFKFSVGEGATATLEINCTANANLIFFSEKQHNAFKKANADKKVKISIASIGNNGTNKKTFWSMECDPPIPFETGEITIS